MNRNTGRFIDDEAEHIRQSIGDILTTPIGSRLKRREYGSLIPELIDQPSNAATRLRLMSASVMAIVRWEPRVTVQTANFTIDMEGRAAIDLTGLRRSGPRSGTPISISSQVMR